MQELAGDAQAGVQANKKLASRFSSLCQAPEGEGEGTGKLKWS